MRRGIIPPNQTPRRKLTSLCAVLRSVPPPWREDAKKDDAPAYICKSGQHFGKLNAGNVCNKVGILKNRFEKGNPPRSGIPFALWNSWYRIIIYNLSSPTPYLQINFRPITFTTQTKHITLCLNTILSKRLLIT
jgi:hypothetical protein